MIRMQMAHCPKCSAVIKKKRKSDGQRVCRRHGPIYKVVIKPYKNSNGCVA